MTNMEKRITAQLKAKGLPYEAHLIRAPFDSVDDEFQITLAGAPTSLTVQVSECHRYLSIMEHGNDEKGFWLRCHGEYKRYSSPSMASLFTKLIALLKERCTH